MFPNRWNGGRGRGGDNYGDDVSGPGRGVVEASGAGGEPEGWSGDTRPLGLWTWCGVVARGRGPGSKERSLKFLVSLELGLEC